MLDEKLFNNVRLPENRLEFIGRGNFVCWTGDLDSKVKIVNAISNRNNLYRPVDLRV